MAKSSELIALKPGFYNGRRVRTGEKFEFQGGKAPSWAAPAGEVRHRVTGKPVRVGDTKPPEARAAVKAKAAGQNDTVVVPDELA